MDDFGHPARASDIESSIERLDFDPRYFTICAEVEGALVGYARFHMLSVLHTTEPWVQVVILVTAVQHRGKGVATAMLRAGEDWGRSHGATIAMLTSGTSRTVTHAFYERHGWQRTGFRFVKSL